MLWPVLSSAPALLFLILVSQPLPCGPLGSLCVSRQGRKGHTWPLHSSLWKGGQGHELEPHRQLCPCRVQGFLLGAWQLGALCSSHRGMGHMRVILTSLSAFSRTKSTYVVLLSPH